MSTKKQLAEDPIFMRGDVAKILNVTPLTIANREKAKVDNNGKVIQTAKYPEPNRDLNGYRIYTLNDVLNLQLITFGAIDTRPILSVLYDKGFRDNKKLGLIIDRALSRRKGEI